MQAMNYQDQLKDPRWHALREAAIKAAGGRCQDCGATKWLQGHHRKYIDDRMAWEYSVEEIKVLCRTCHHGYHIVAGELKPKARELVQLEKDINAAKVNCFEAECAGDWDEVRRWLRHGITLVRARIEAEKKAA